MVEVVPAFLENDAVILRQRFKQVRARRYHVDIMDGTFVPWKSASPSVLKGVKAHIDVHFMVDRPTQKLPALDGLAERVFVPLETVGNVSAFVEKAHALGMKAGLCINPETPFRRIARHLARIDAVVVLLVHPGRQGQPFVRRALGKIRAVRRRFPALSLLADGGVNLRTIRDVIKAGADEVVAGSAVVCAPEPQKALAELRKAASS